MNRDFVKPGIARRPGEADAGQEVPVLGVGKRVGLLRRGDVVIDDILAQRCSRRRNHVQERQCAIPPGRGIAIAVPAESKGHEEIGPYLPGIFTIDSNLVHNGPGNILLKQPGLGGEGIEAITKGHVVEHVAKAPKNGNLTFGARADVVVVGVVREAPGPGDRACREHGASAAKGEVDDVRPHVGILCPAEPRRCLEDLLGGSQVVIRESHRARQQESSRR